jgi:hypothetical protein
MSSVFGSLKIDTLATIDARARKRNVHLLKDPAPRAFTPAEKALIAKVHGYMPARQLLDILNERLACDLGPDAIAHTMEQLHAEIGAAAVVPDGGHDWSSLRQLVANARRGGVLDKITRQVIDDFAVVYSLSSGQVLRLQDVLLRAKEGDEA